MMMCLDTNILVSFLRNDKTTVEIIEKLENKDEIALTAVTLFELYYGACKSSKRTTNLLAVNDLKKRVEILTFDAESSKLAGKILDTLEKKGKVIDLRDVFIGAITISNKIPFTTNNIKHFNRLVDFGLKLQDFKGLQI
ncbi:MAG: type II toxin-antitoxin system VapC family toxin [Promethearchaeota archaeon]